MMDYVIKQKYEPKYRIDINNIIINSNFDWEPLYIELKRKFEEKQTKSRILQNEHEFCLWLRDLIINYPEMTRNSKRNY